MSKINSSMDITDAPDSVATTKITTAMPDTLLTDTSKTSIRTLQVKQRYDWYAKAGSFLYLTSGAVSICATVCVPDGLQAPVKVRLHPEDYYVVTESGWLQLQAHAACEIRIEENTQTWRHQCRHWWMRIRNWVNPDASKQESAPKRSVYQH